LEYVEKFLREKNTNGLTKELKMKRVQLLDLLHNYWVSGIFPSNYDYPGIRIPCFIDKDGKICAVGYLIEKTAGIQIAEHINSKHKYQKILEMNDPLVNSWVTTSGLTLGECATIQPDYGPIQPFPFSIGTTTAYVWHSNTKELELTKRVDSQKVILSQLQFSLDSVNLKIKNQEKVINNLSLLYKNDEKKIIDLNKVLEKQKSNWITIWVATLIFGTSLIFLIIKFKNKKINHISKM